MKTRERFSTHGACLCMVVLLSACQGPEVPPNSAFFDTRKGAQTDTQTGAQTDTQTDSCKASAVDCSIAENTGVQCESKDKVCFEEKCRLIEYVKNQLKQRGLVWVPAAGFEMGCVPNDENCNANESPRTRVLLSPFFVQEAEVTVEQYNACIKSGKCTSPSSVCPSGPNNAPTTYNNFTAAKTDQQYLTHPMTCVTWEEAKNYCSTMVAGGDLPTEAQFEYLMRRNGGADWIYPHGNSMPPSDGFANLPNALPVTGSGAFGNTLQNSLILDYKDSAVATWAVKTGTPTEEIFDLWGNAWEWTRDRVSKGSQLKGKTVLDPVQAAVNGNPVIRGAGFYYTGKVKGDHYVALRTSFRLDAMPTTHLKDDLGFRCVLDIRPLDCLSD